MRQSNTVPRAPRRWSWIAYDRKQVAHAEALSAAARHAWRTLGTSIEAFGPQLSRFAEGHAPPRRAARVPDEGHVAHRFRDPGDGLISYLVLGTTASDQAAQMMQRC